MRSCHSGKFIREKFSCNSSGAAEHSSGCLVCHTTIYWCSKHIACCFTKRCLSESKFRHEIKHNLPVDWLNDPQWYNTNVGIYAYFANILCKNSGACVTCCSSLQPSGIYSWNLIYILNSIKPLSVISVITFVWLLAESLARQILKMAPKITSTSILLLFQLQMSLYLPTRILRHCKCSFQCLPQC